MPFQDSLDACPPYLIPKRPENVSKPCVTPAGVLDGHRDHKGSELVCGARTADSSPLRPVVFRGYKLAIPAQNGVGPDDASAFSQAPSSDELAPSRETPALGICEATRPSTEQLEKNLVLLLEVFNHGPLLSLQPTRDHRDDEMH